MTTQQLADTILYSIYGLSMFTLIFILLWKVDRLFLHLNFIKSQNIKIMTLQDQINQVLGNIAADITAGATDAANISAGIGTLSTGLAKLLANAGIDGSSVLSTLQTIQGNADTLKTNLDSAAAAVTSAAATIPVDPATGTTTGAGTGTAGSSPAPQS